MLLNLFNGWTALLLMVVGCSYLLVIYLTAKREARPRPLTESELLAKLGRIGPDTEYDIFFHAARDWRVSKDEVESDFKEYLHEGTIPYYVNSYLRKRALESGNFYRPPFLLGGGSLPWLK